MVKYKDLNSYNLETNKKFFTIAEIGINHQGDLEKAKQLIKSASVTNCNAVKFQTYITENRVDKNSNIYDILKKCELNFKDFETLKNVAEENNLIFFSTPFDTESVNVLNQIGCKIFKIASFDSANKKLLSEVSKVSKTSILSSGITQLSELKEAYKILNSNNNKTIILHCVSSYPTKIEDANLSKIDTLKNHFDCVVGHSDHTNDIFIPLLAAAKGAQVLEKHYKIDENMDCPDSVVSITENQMKQLNEQLFQLEEALGNNEIKIQSSEKNILPFKRYS